MVVNKDKSGMCCIIPLPLYGSKKKTDEPDVCKRSVIPDGFVKFEGVSWRDVGDIELPADFMALPITMESKSHPLSNCANVEGHTLDQIWDLCAKMLAKVESIEQRMSALESRGTVPLPAPHQTATRPLPPVHGVLKKQSEPDPKKPSAARPLVKK